MWISRLIIFTSVSMTVAACSGNLEKEIESSWPDGSPQKVIYFENQGGERIKIREERFYENGTQEMTGEYNGLKKEGEWIYWYDDGRKWSQANYKNDIKEGKTIVWRENGYKIYEGAYATGKPHGSWIFYDADGSRIKEVLFEYGEKVNEVTFKEGVPFNFEPGDSLQFRIE